MLEVSSATEFDTAAAGRVVVEFWAPWCGPCRTFAPVFAAAESAHPTVRFVKANVDVAPDLAARFRARSIPTTVVVDDGVVVASRAGVLRAAELDALIGTAAPR